MYAERTFMLLFIFSAFSTCHALHTHTSGDEPPLAFKNLESLASLQACQDLPFGMSGATAKEWTDKLDLCRKSILRVWSVPEPCYRKVEEKTKFEDLQNQMEECSKAVREMTKVPDNCKNMEPGDWSKVEDQNDETWSQFVKQEEDKLAKCSLAWSDQLLLPEQCAIDVLQPEVAWVLKDNDGQKTSDLMEAERDKMCLCSKATCQKLNVNENCCCKDKDKALDVKECARAELRAMGMGGTTVDTCLDIEGPTDFFKCIQKLVGLKG